jgi:hypothetical protein
MRQVSFQTSFTSLHVTLDEVTIFQPCYGKMYMLLYDVCFVTNQNSKLDFYGASSLKQWSSDSSSTLFIILTQSQPVFAT